MDEIEKMHAAQELVDDAGRASLAIIEKSSQLHQPWSESLVIYLSVAVLAFALLLSILATILLLRTNVVANYVIRLFGIIAIITFSALLLVVGYSNDQLTPIVGLFGAIAGYLLGKDASQERSVPPI